MGELSWGAPPAENVRIRDFEAKVIQGLPQIYDISTQGLAQLLFTKEPLCYTTPEQQLLKAQKELAELFGAADKDSQWEELSDVLVCLLGYAIKKGFTWDMLVRGLDTKLGINIRRNWTRQEDGTYQHD